MPTHLDGRSLYWEFATDGYDIGFGLFFEWVDPEDTQVRHLVLFLLSFAKGSKIPPSQQIEIKNPSWFQSGIISLWLDLNFDIMFAKKLPFKAFSFFIQFVLCIHCKCYIFSNDLFFVMNFAHIMYCHYHILFDELFIVIIYWS